MSGNFQCPQGQICSGEFGTAVGSRNTNLFLRTSTAVSQGTGTQVTGGTTTLYTWVPDTTTGLSFGTGQGSWKPAAKSSDGKNWSLLKGSDGKQILGADAANSLTNPAGNLNKNVAARTTTALKGAGLTPQQTQKIVKSNTATGQENSSQQQSKPLTQQELLNDESIKDGGVRTSYPKLLTYPITRDPKQDYIKFSMFRYEPKKVTSGKEGDEFGGRGDNRAILGSVTLPIQPSISDMNTVSWVEDELNALQETGARASLQIMGGDVEGAASDAAKTVTDNAPALKAQAAATFASAAVGTNARLFTRLTGSIVNPNLELLFKGPSLRSFSFTFSLSAREEKEAEEIRKIIRFFKQGMSVKRAATSLYLKSPNTFGISYIYGGTGAEHPWMNKIKECALQNFSVNYTPAGNYATYEDGAMVQYDIAMTFGELDPIYDDDYKDDGDTTIGY